MELNLFTAFLAGLISFLAPCVFPLLPSYIMFISGVSLKDLERSPDTFRKPILISSLFYIFGFSLIFVLLGLSATSLSHLLIVNRFLLIQIGGILIVLLGVYSLGALNNLKFSSKEYHISFPKKMLKIKYIGAFLLGVTFALAWTPCVGAILGAILTLAATTENLSQGALLLFVYSLGISLPFLLIALTLGRSYKILSKLDKFTKVASILGGIFLIILGLTLVFQKYYLINDIFSSFLNNFEFYNNLQGLL